MLRSTVAIGSGSSLSESAHISNSREAHVVPPPRKHSSHQWKKSSDKKNKNGYFEKLIRKKNKQEKAVIVSNKDAATTSSNTYPSTPINALPGNLLNEYLSVSTDATGQYVALVTEDVTFYLSSNYGETYDLSFSPLYYDESNDGLGSVAIASNAPNYISFTGYDGIYASNNTGASFTLVPSTANSYSWIGLTMSSTGQYVYATYGGGFYSNQGYLVASTDYSQTFNLLTNAVVGGYVALATSANGQYFFATTQTTVYGSSDYGNTLPIVFSLGAITSVGCSSTAQYVGVVTGSGYIYISSDYGQTWKNTYSSSTTVPYPPGWSGISFSSTGQNVLVVGSFYPVYTSSNYGQSFQEIVSSSSQQYAYGAISASGQYMYAVGAESYPYSSNNYGASWTPLYYGWSGVASSQNGEYRLACLEDTQPALYISSNSGSTWSIVTSSMGMTKYYFPYQVACNNNCQYIFMIPYVNQVLVSSNYGKSWKLVTYGNPNFETGVGIYTANAVRASSSGQYVTLVTDIGPIFISSNYGSSFSQATTSLTENYMAVAMSSNGAIQLAGTGVNYYNDDDANQSK